MFSLLRFIHPQPLSVVYHWVSPLVVNQHLEWFQACRCKAALQKGATSDQTPLQWPGPRLLVHLCCTVHSLKLALAATLKPHRPAEGGQYTMEQVPNFPSQTCSTGSLPTATWWQAPHSGGQDRPPLLVHPLHYTATTGSPLVGAGRWCVVQEAQVYKTTSGQSARSPRPNLAQSNLSLNLFNNIKSVKNIVCSKTSTMAATR